MSAVFRLMLFAIILASGVGCAHVFEARAINHFADNLRGEDLSGLKKSTSSAFEERALRTTSALEDLKILRLPDGKATVVEVEELSPGRKRVTAEVGEGKREIFYELIKEDSGPWVVDDIYLKQRKAGVTAFKSLTEQMDLLLTVREFLDAWTEGDRDRVLATSGPQLRPVLATLPPTYLAELTTVVVGEQGKSFKPNASMDDDTAVVRFSRTAGELVLTLNRDHDAWVLQDIAIDAKDEVKRIPSLWKQALALKACVEFLDAYEASDKTRLSKLVDKDFFEGSLATANLKQALLPSPMLADHEVQLVLRKQRADVTLKATEEIVQIDMRREDPADPSEPPSFSVRDVTIYEYATKQEKRLSAMFTAQGMLSEFCHALADRDLARLRHTSTHDFAHRVWQRLNLATMLGLPLDAFDDPALAVVTYQFQGPVTRVEVRQGGEPVTYVLREESGQFVVDDILWQVPGRPASVKQTLELLIPIRNFAAAIALSTDPTEQAAALDLLKDASSSDLNRFVWQQADFVPNGGLSADLHLNAPLRSLAQTDEMIVAKFGDGHYGAEVQLRKQHHRIVVDDVTLIAGPNPDERWAIKSTLRTILAEGRGIRPGSEARPIFATAKPKARPSGPMIQQAVYEEPADAREPLKERWSTDDTINIDVIPASAVDAPTPQKSMLSTPATAAPPRKLDGIQQPETFRRQRTPSASPPPRRLSDLLPDPLADDRPQPALPAQSEPR